MHFAEFEGNITSTELKTLVRHWNDARGDRTVPAWRDIRPAKISKVLPIVWAYTYNVQNDAFTGRLAGNRIDEIFGKSFRGAPLAAIQPPEAFPWVHELLRRVVTEPAAYLGTGRVFQQRERYGRGERIILPLGGDGEHGVLGATDYHRSDFVPKLSGSPVGEFEIWCSLAR